MEIEVDIIIRESDNDIKIVDLAGKFDTGTSPKVESKLKEIISNGTLKLLINFEKVNYISSAGLRVLLTVAKMLKTSSGELKICNLNDVAKEIFEISGFTSILNVYSSEDEALKDF